MWVEVEMGPRWCRGGCRGPNENPAPGQQDRGKIGGKIGTKMGKLLLLPENVISLRHQLQSSLHVIGQKSSQQRGCFGSINPNAQLNGGRRTRTRNQFLDSESSKRPDAG